jgi:hypothetical protein
MPEDLEHFPARYAAAPRTMAATLENRGIP